MPYVSKKTKDPRGDLCSITSVSRVLYWTVIYLGRTSPYASLPPVKLPSKLKTLRWVLLRIGFTWPHGLPHAGELLPRLSTLTAKNAAVSLCCTGPEVTFGRRYLLSCSAEPGLSSLCGCPHLRDCLEWWIFILTQKFYFVNLLIIFCFEDIMYRIYVF